MSSSPYSRTQPGDLTDDSYNRNPKFTKAHPNRKGISISLERVHGNLCSLCGWQYELNAEKCPDCGSVARKVFGPNELVDVPPRNVAAHFRRKVVYCWNTKEDPISGDVSRHQLIEKLRDVVNLSTREFHREAFCETCEAVYSFREGRLATDEELERAKAGRIPAPAPAQMVMGRGSSP